MTVDWVRSHANEIPGRERLGVYYRFHRASITKWLGSLEPLLEVEYIAGHLQVPPSWVYANADRIPGVLRLGRYVRFRPTVFHSFLGGTGTCQ